MIFILLLLGAANGLSGQETRSISGSVRSRLDSTGLDRTVVSVVGSGLSTRSGPLGNFRIQSAPTRNFRLTAARPGFEPETLAVTVGATTVDIFLNPIPVELNAVLVRGVSGALDRFLDDPQTSRVTLGVVDIQRAPALMEADVLRSVQLLPGTVSKNDYSVGFNVRGGESDQNLVLLDGVTVFNPSHLGGLFSVFDASAINDVNFQTGAFSARYDGRLSSVVDIGMRQGNDQRVAVSGQLSLLSSKLLVEGPIGAGSFIVGARRTYIDGVVGAFSKEEVPYYFGDLVGRLDFPIGESSHISVTGYWGRDNLDFELVEPKGTDDGVNLDFNWGNRLLGVNTTHTFGVVDVQNHLSVTEFSTGLGLLPGIIRYDNSARLLTARSTATYHPTPDRDRTFGISAQRYDMDFRLGSTDAAVTFIDQGYQPTILSAFFDEVWRVNTRVIVSTGFRFDKGAGSANFGRLSPRISGKVFVDNTTALTASAGIFHQAIHSLRDQEQPLTIFEFWIGADSVVPVARADHFVLGLEKWFGTEHSLSIEAYRKDYTDLLTVNRLDDPDILGDEFLETTGRSEGFDFHFKRHTGRWRGWISYSFLKAHRELPGERFPPSQDRRHSLNVVLTGPGPLGSDMGVRWGFGSPIPFTGIVGEFNHREYSAFANGFVSSQPEPIGSALNAERYPSYSRLDLSFRWPTRKWGGTLTPFVNLLNAYNRQNVFLYFFDFTESPVTRTGISQLPLLPTVGVEFRW